MLGGHHAGCRGSCLVCPWLSAALGGPCPRARLGGLHGAAGRAGGKAVASDVSLDVAGTCCWVSQQEGPEVPRGSSASS